MPAAIAALSALIVLARGELGSICCSRISGLSMVVNTGFIPFPWLACLNTPRCAGGVPGSLALL